jgi:hypothetical protein
VDDLMNRRQVRRPRDWDKKDSDNHSGGNSEDGVKSSPEEDSPIGKPVEDA